jgi:AhpD family alkylhydroperoxidase
METLNKDAAELMAKYEGNACTDVTGFGLAGHLLQMVQGSGVSAEIDLSRVPVFAAVKTCIEEDMWPGAVERNHEYAMAWVQVDDPGGPRSLPILYDPQTSGGLLISLPEMRARKLVEELHARGHEAAAVIGRIVERTSTDTDGKIIVTNSKLENLVGKRGTTMTFEKGASTPPASNEAEPGCCVEVDANARASALPAAPDARGTDSLALFTQFMKESNQAGCLDARTKKLIAIALSVVQRCEPCLKTHAKAAFAMGLSLAEIDEAANLAVAFGGCTAMTFYKALRETLPPMRSP